MKIKTIALTTLLLLCSIIFATEPMRDPFIELKINGVTYIPGDRIEIRSGERFTAEAILMGGRRDYCMDPQTYANIGRNTVIETSGMNGMSFNINSGQFRGKWSLVSEKAEFSSASGVKITQAPASGDIQRTATIEVVDDRYGEVFLRVNSTTEWYYVRNTPGGQTEENETDTGSDSFTIVITKEEGVWFSSNNLSVKGDEDFSVRNSLDQIQRFYDLIEKCLIDKNYSCANMHHQNLIGAVQDLNNAIARAKENNPSFECEVTFIGAPSDVPMEHLNKIRAAKNQWRDMYFISQENSSNINEMLLNTQMTFSANVLRSVFKNYIDWGSGLPTGFMDIVTMHDPNNIFGALSLPTQLLDFYSTAVDDASILENQATTIRHLSELREFYLKRMESSVGELRELHKITTELKPVEDFHLKISDYIKSLRPHNYRSK